MSYDPSEHIIAHGTKISYADPGGTPSYIDITGTSDIAFPEVELSTAEITNDSTPDFGKDYLPGMAEPGKLSFKYVYGKTQFAALETIYQLARASATRATATKLWKITLPDGSTATTTGFMTKHSYGGGSDDDVPEVDVEIQCRSKLVFVAGT